MSLWLLVADYDALVEVWLSWANERYLGPSAPLFAYFLAALARWLGACARTLR